MPQTTLYDRTGASVGSVELSAELFDAAVNPAVIHQVVTAPAESLSGALFVLAGLPVYFLWARRRSPSGDIARENH